MVWQLLADYHIKNERYKDGLACATNAVKYAPKSRISQMNFVICLYQLKQYDRAEKGIDIVLENFPNDVTALELKGELCLLRGAIKSAVFYFSRCLKLDGKKSSVYSRLANCYEKLGDRVKMRLMRKLAEDQRR
ncbi:MAG: tetratricopeptide repeat protein [Planctomycetota bacterium]|nr:tetratricopeptide repeat protein [Planctomycetota bacterium]